MVDVNATIEDISNNKKSLQESLDVILLRQKELEAELEVELEAEPSKLTGEVVSNSGFYFERAKKQVSFLYSQLDLSMMDFFKVVCDGQLVDKEMAASLEPKDSASTKDTQDDGGATVGDESGVPQLEDVMREEET